MLLSDIYNCL